VVGQDAQVLFIPAQPPLEPEVLERGAPGSE
jgi:hypothetical protein